MKSTGTLDSSGSTGEDALRAVFPSFVFRPMTGKYFINYFQLQFVGFLDLVVDISVVVQRQVSMVIDARCAARVFASRCRVVVDFSLLMVLTILFGTVSGR